MKEFFGGSPDLIFIYSREQAIEEGVLIDVTPIARQAGYRIPVALTCALMGDIQDVPEGMRTRPGMEVDSRLFDVLNQGNIAIHRGASRSSELCFTLPLPVGGDTNPYQEYSVKIVIGPDEEDLPCFTFMCPQED